MCLGYSRYGFIGTQAHRLRVHIYLTSVCCCLRSLPSSVVFPALEADGARERQVLLDLKAKHLKSRGEANDGELNAWDTG